VEDEESKREKNRNEEPPALYSRDNSPAGLHSRAEERARWSFPAPARATRRRPEIAPVRRAQPSSGETNPSRVSPQSGCGVGFGRGWPGATSDQGRKQVRLQPMGARPTWANLTNTPLVSLCSGGLSCVVKREAKGRGGTWSGLVSCLISPAMTSSYFLLLLACMLPSAPIGSWKPRACTLLLR
jgi:hypothetical protein